MEKLNLLEVEITYSDPGEHKGHWATPYIRGVNTRDIEQLFLSIEN